MRDQEFVDLSVAYNQICEQVKIPPGKTAEDVLQELIPAGEKVKKVKPVKEAKDETEEGITGLPIPKKKMSPAKRHKFEQERRKERKKKNDPRVGDTFSQHRMTGSRGHGSENFANPRVSYRHNEEYLIDYLLDEGFASDEKSAEAIMGAMSEAWIESICESLIGDFESKQRQQSGYKGPAGSVKTTPGYKSPIETRNDIKPEMRHLFLQAKNKSSNSTQTA